jgi:hypothetical protein
MEMALLRAVVVFLTYYNFRELPLALRERAGVRALAVFSCTSPW